MDKPRSDFYFRFMCFVFRVRDWLSPRANVLREAGIAPGARVLDYGCGPGGYLLPLSKLVGETGEIIALDIHPLAVQRVQRIAEANGLKNVRTIQSDGETGLSDASVDAVLLYDVFHDLAEPDQVLGEIHRVLRPGGVLSFSDHHLREPEIVDGVTSTGRFRLVTHSRKTYTFAPAG